MHRIKVHIKATRVTTMIVVEIRLVRICNAWTIVVPHKAPYSDAPTTVADHIYHTIIIKIGPDAPYRELMLTVH